MSSTTKETERAAPSAKLRTRRSKRASSEKFEQKPDETFEEFYARVWNFVHDAYARAREAEEKERAQP